MYAAPRSHPIDEVSDATKEHHTAVESRNPSLTAPLLRKPRGRPARRNPKSFADVDDTEWPSQVFGAHKPFSIMNYGSKSVLTPRDRSDLKRLYQLAWKGKLFLAG